MDYRILNGELYHWGIKGQKWGVRRYQNKDGTLTPAGKKRYDNELATMKESKRKNHVANPDKWATEDVSRTKGVVDATSSLNRELGNAANTVDKHFRKKAPDIDLSNMSDKEMRDAINRKLLERQYKDVVVPQNVSRGKERAETVLALTGSVLGVTSAALGIALSIRQLMGKG